MAVDAIEIKHRELYAAGRQFGDAGQYERLEILVHYSVDPALPENQPIVDLDLATRAEDGRVHFSGDLTLLVPADPSKACGALLVEVPNRGSRVAFRQFHQAPLTQEATARLDPGDGFLLNRGWLVAFCGWQWDVPRSNARIGLQAPLLPDSVTQRDTQAQLRMQPNQDTQFLQLTDGHVGQIGNHRLIETIDIDDDNARLLVRDEMYGSAQTIDRKQWRFAKGENGDPDPGHVWLEGGFKAGRIYDLMYVPRECPVAGCGMLAVRDVGAFLSRDERSPIYGLARNALCEGLSQCGRFLRTFLFNGLNRAEDGLAAYDGFLVHIAGGRRGEFNHRYAQPSVQPTPSFGHLFPFGDGPQIDPNEPSAHAAGLLDRQLSVGCMPKVIYTDTSSEYWRGDAALTHLRLDTMTDAELPAEVRRYLFTSTQHGAGTAAWQQQSIFGTKGGNHFNIIDYRPLYRAAIINLWKWVSEDEPPPESRYPRIADGSLVSRESVMHKLAAIPGLDLPAEERLPSMVPLDLGPSSDAGIAELPATPTGNRYPALVSDVDSDGNEIAGIAMPDVLVPVASHTGFNPRHADTGNPGQLLEYLGSTLPMAANESMRIRTGDPRRAISERYQSRDDYLRQVREAALKLAGDRYVLAEDIELCLDIAAARYDCAIGAEATDSPATIG